MNFTFSQKVTSLHPSAIREILKATSDPGVIPFAAGNPAAEAFPADDIAAITAQILQNAPTDALQYSITEGYAPLRGTMSAYLHENERIGRDFDRLIITAGAQQVMDLTVRALCDEGDVVLCESPSFIGSLNAFRAAGARLCGIPLAPDGLDIAALEAALKREKRAKLIYVIPNFQNPSGITMSADKRRAVYALARQYGVPILEDNPYGDLRFAGEHIPTIKSLDEAGLVIYAGSFSKVLAPGLRVGYAVAPEPVIAKLTVCKQVSDVHTAMLPQLIAHQFITTRDFAAHLCHLRAIYRRKATLMMRLCDTHLAEKLTYQPVEGGLFLWGRLPDGVNMPAFCQNALSKQVAIVPGSAFLPDESAASQYIRLNFSTPSDEQIEQGIQILARSFD